MKKYLIITVSAISMSGTAWADPFNGPYIGAQGGYDSYNVQGSGTLSGAGTISHIDLGADGASFGLFAGYGKTTGTFYLGAEAEGSINNAEMRLTDNAGDDFGIKSKNTFGANLRAGFLPNPNTLIYASVGAVRTKYDGERQLTGSKSLTGARFGLGTETIFSPNISGRLGWTYTDYEEYKYSTTGFNAKLSPKESLFRAGIAYNF